MVSMAAAAAAAEGGRGLGCIGIRRGDSMISSRSHRRLRAIREGRMAKTRPVSSVLGSWICILSIPSFFPRWASGISIKFP